MKSLRKVTVAKMNIPAKIFFILYVSLVMIPIVLSVLNSFKSAKSIQMSFLVFNAKIFTLEGYKTAMSMLRFFEGLRNNIIIMAISIALTVIFGSLMGYVIAVLNTKLLRGAYVLAILLICIPIHAIMFQLIAVLNTIHLLNNYLGTSLIFASLSLPVAVFLYTGFMRTLPKELCEAAIVEGCGVFRTYLSIYFPLMKSITAALIILRGTFIWNDLLVSLITISDSTKTMLVPRMYGFNSSTATRWNLVFASSVLISIPVITLYVFLQKAFIRGLVAGAVKG